MKVEVVSRKLVKPATPTPETKKTYKISFMDELNPTMNIPMVLYYPASTKMNEKLNHLEQSLSQILTQFHPFAGRYKKDGCLVDCGDQGAQLILANVDVEMLQVIDPDSKFQPEELNDLLPCEIGAADEETDPILNVKISKFACGGVAIGVCISHRLIDVSSLGAFIYAWANASRGGSKEGVTPSFDGAVYFPGKTISPPEFGTNRTNENGLGKIVAKKYVFDKNAISGLKERVAGSNELLKLTRNQVVCGLVTKAIAGIDKSKDLLIVQAVNMRGRTVPPLPRFSIGNLVDLSITERSAAEAKKMGFKEFVLAMGDDARRTVNNCAKILSEGEKGHRHLIETSHYASEKSLVAKDVVVVWYTDCTKFRFYEADFGCGGPVWAGVCNVVIKNHVVLMTTKEGDGIEAWVQLEEADMPYFEQELDKLIV